MDEPMVTVPRRLVESVCEDAEAAVVKEYGGLGGVHPALRRHYDRDMADIRELRALLAQEARNDR